MEHLFEKLRQYAGEDIYPYHMPGHKRQSWGELPKACCELDITEIDGFDNLHQSEGILEKLQQKASQLYGAEESFYLVNGSTCGILSAVSCALPPGGHILMARNCHKSAYHAAYLRSLKISYLYPFLLKEYDICEAVTPQQVRWALEQEPDIGAVLIVSPTYEGRTADVKAIAGIVHEKGIPLIVDEAHGAHLGLEEGWPQNSCRQGADLVIHSVHKTLPALTQTALLHVNGNRIDRMLLKRFLKIYQSSSPSYLLMASIDNALQYIEKDGVKAFARFREYFCSMMASLAKCRKLRFLPEGIFSDGQEIGEPELAESGKRVKRMRHDIGKLVISVKGTELSGKQLYDILLEKYRLQAEMAAESYVLAMFTINDGEEAYRRMAEALLEVDGQIFRKTFQGWEEGSVSRTEGGETTSDAVSGAAASFRAEGQLLISQEDGLTADAIPLAGAWDQKTETVSLEDSVGRYVGEFINLYPPGIPLLVPGERMTGRLCGKISEYLEQGLNVQGICTAAGNPEIKVIIGE